MTHAGASPIAVCRLRKNYQGLRPLRINALTLRQGDRLAIAGIDTPAAEAFTHLVTGAALPDEGDVVVFGTNTRDIHTDTEWLVSLDRFGIVTERAVLLEQITVASNIALPLTLAIDPMADAIRRQVESLADEVEIGRDRLAARAGDLTPVERLRVHLARALALGPTVLLLEHPTAPLTPRGARDVGATLRRISAARRLSWIAVTEDREFAAAASARRLTLSPGTGDLAAEGFWSTLWT